MKNLTKKELEEKWLTVCHKAKYWRGVSETGNHILPEWYDHDKIEESQKFINKDFSG